MTHERTTHRSRRLPIGAEAIEIGRPGVHVRVWAPKRARVIVRFERDAVAPLELSPEREAAGYFSGFSPHARAGDRYAFHLDDDPKAYPDPASRYQPDGPHGPSVVVDPRTFAWTDHAWSGITAKGQVLYELHLGTFTPEGTLEAARAQLGELARLGITVVELMPVAEYPGRFGWGYDGVGLYAPSHLYGTPDELRAFIDRAHALGIGVLLDVVYNHLGPDGAYLRAFSDGYFTDRYANEWGDALCFEGDASAGAREFFVENAGYWIDEYHFDGLRLDATQSIFDASREHVIASLAKRARERAGRRSIYLVAENEPQHAKLARPTAQGGYGLDALWNDDLHHTAIVALTGRRTAYYNDYTGSARELLAALTCGYLYQGQRYRWQKQRRGRYALDLGPHTFVSFLENHDQVANSTRGLRLSSLSDPASLRALTALWLLAPPTPMFFQGQEFASSKPFFYFADHQPSLAPLVRKGREDFIAQFHRFTHDEARATVADPGAAESFERCKLDLRERETHAAHYALVRDLLALRRAVLARVHEDRDALRGAVLSEHALVLRYLDRADPTRDRLVVCNLGTDLEFDPCPEPLLAPPDGHRWSLAWSSERAVYGGNEAACPDDDERGWSLLGRCTYLLEATPSGDNETVETAENPR